MVTKELLIELESVGVYYLRKGMFFQRRSDKFWALKDVSLKLHRGESLGVIGRNGAGKSTLLAVMAGILRPDRGEMRAKDVTASMLSLQVGFIPYLSGRENIMMSGLLLGSSRARMREVMGDIIEFAELGDFIDQPIYTYSSGMKARLGFSVAIHSDPDVILIDEMLGVGDQDFRQKSQKAMQDLIKSEKTVVVVSHSPETIRDLCDRVVLIDNGASVMRGDPDKVLEHYLSGAKQ